MRYHWEWINADQIVLFEEGASWSGALDGLPGAFAVINKTGPYAGTAAAVYKVTRPAVDEAKDFTSNEEAMLFVESLVREKGDVIEGRAS